MMEALARLTITCNLLINLNGGNGIKEYNYYGFLLYVKRFL